MTRDPARAREIRRILLLTFAGNVAVLLAKAITGFAADALSVVAEAAHSSVDALNNVIALTLSRLAAQAPDEDHPYGHAKFETVGALAVVAFLSITVFELTASALRRLTGAGPVPQATPAVLAVMAFSAVANFLISRYEARRGRDLGSDLLMADAAHTRSDVYASLAVLAGLLVVAAGYPIADALITLVVALVIARAGWRIVRNTVPVLVDERAVEQPRIARVARATPGVEDCYDIRSRGRLGEVFAELTIAVSGRLNVQEAHEIADEVERRVARDLGAREVVVHVEPTAREQAAP